MCAAGLTFRSLGSSGACWAPRRTIRAPPFDPMSRAPFEVVHRPRGPIRICAGRSLRALPRSCLPSLSILPLAGAPALGGSSSLVVGGRWYVRRRARMGREVLGLGYAPCRRRVAARHGGFATAAMADLTDGDARDNTESLGGRFGNAAGRPWPRKILYHY